MAVTADLSDAELKRFWAHVDRRDGAECWLYMDAHDHNGYGRFWLRTTMEAAHRVAWAAAHPGEAVPQLLRHKCDVRACCNASHMLPGTHADNMRDMSVRERSASTKLTAIDVWQIRQESAAGASKGDLAARYGVTTGNIWFIINGRTWRHVPLPPEPLPGL